MTAAESVSIVSWWGACLSTLLAFVKIWELWRDRFRVDVGFLFSSDVVAGNTIRIRNLSGDPIILCFWEVLYVSGVWPVNKFEAVEYPDHDAADQKIDPHSTLELNFSEQNYFSWGHKALKGRRIAIRLHIAGRKPILKLVYP